jgi:hypothetical protein
MTTKFTKEQHEIIDALQQVHDSYRPSDWAEELEKVAIEFNLK